MQRLCVDTSWEFAFPRWFFKLLSHFICTSFSIILFFSFLLILISQFSFHHFLADLIDLHSRMRPAQCFSPTKMGIELYIYLIPTINKPGHITWPQIYASPANIVINGFVNKNYSNVLCGISLNCVKIETEKLIRIYYAIKC